MTIEQISEFLRISKSESAQLNHLDELIYNLLNQKSLKYHDEIFIEIKPNSDPAQPLSQLDEQILNQMRHC